MDSSTDEEYLDSDDDYDEEEESHNNDYEDPYINLDDDDEEDELESEEQENNSHIDADYDYPMENDDDDDPSPMHENLGSPVVLSNTGTTATPVITIIPGTMATPVTTAIPGNAASSASVANPMTLANPCTLVSCDVQKSIVHMFLPKRTPDKLEDDLLQIEEDMLTRVAYSFYKIIHNSNDLLELTPVHVMLVKWQDVQPKSSTKHNGSEKLRSAFEGLQVGNTIPIYIRQQNCTMMITKIVINGKETVRVQTFRASLPSEIVMSSVDPLKMNFPETSNLIENEKMLGSKVYASQLYEMATKQFDISMGTAMKGGNVYTETRDVPQPFLVSEWAVGVLVPREDPTSLFITKTIRDQVTMGTQNSRLFIPFRRSGLWMSIKIVLHLKILEVFGGDKDTATLVYKLVMLQILADTCRSYQVQKGPFDLDLASQMLAKVGRRVEKLQKLSCGNRDKLIAVNLDRIRAEVLDHTLEVLTTLRQAVQYPWNEVALSKESKSRPICLSLEDFKKCLMHHIKPLDEVVKKALKQIQRPLSMEKQDISDIKQRSLEAVKRMEKGRSTMTTDIAAWISKCNRSGFMTGLASVDFKIWLYETERFVKGIKDEHNYSSKDIFGLGKCYVAKARENKDNPLGFSQMLLVSLKLTCILDRMATKKHPLLLNYKLDIKPSSFDCLLLPHEHDVHLLNELLDYVNSRDSKATHPILERRVDQNTFSVKYAESNQEIIQLKDRIKSDIEESRNKKFEEVEKERKECRDLEKQMEDLGGSCSCRYEEKTIRFWNRRWQNYTRKVIRTKIYDCDYCPLKSKLDGKRKSVGVYEVPLPPDQQNHLQNAVIFELHILDEFSHLRQFLAMLKYELLGEAVFSGGGNEKPKHKWLEYRALKSTNYTSKSTNMITLGSMASPASSTHHTSNNPDLLYSSNSSFIVNNGMDCHFHYSKDRDPANTREECSFNLSKTSGSEWYLSLQKYLISTEHSQNDVIANQSDCHQQLSLDEYITFGSLRAGHRTQMRNLYRAISSRSLSLEKEPVLALVLQTIWQVGPRDKDGVREAHVDFKEDGFASQFLELLEELVKYNEANYSSPLILMTAVFITGRIMELNEKCREKCYQLFKDWRRLTKTWSIKIDVSDNSKCPALKTTMQKILHEIKMCSLMTYMVCSSDQMRNVCKVDEDFSHLLHTISSKNLLSKESDPSFSSFMGILRLVEESIPVRLKLDTLIATGKKIQGEGGIASFIEEKFPSAKKYKNYEVTKASDNIIMVQFSNDYIIVLDTITGELLINGFPETELSSEISSNEGFKRFFQKHLNFRVQRQSSSVLRTSEPFHGKHYEFRSPKSRSSFDYYLGRHGVPKEEKMYITEIQENYPSLVFVPHQTFRGFLSDHFIDNYTHWLDPIKESIYFRRIAVNDHDYDLPSEYILKKTIDRHKRKVWMLQDEISQQFLMSIKSNGFMLLTHALSRLEWAKHINVFMNCEKTVVGAHLPRHNLRFTVNRSGILESMEYPGFQISLDQGSMGTFIGLESGLLLENGLKRNIIIPHGRIKISKESSKNHPHHFCQIDLKSLSQPSFYLYEFDDVLKRIVAKKSVSSWVYLAALHAVTSSSQPDPFTGMTGTEMAVHILQSAIVWSCSPYDKESLEILKFITELSPVRNYHGHNKYVYGSKNEGLKEEIETIEWPVGIPATAAYDGYALLVNDLIHDSVRLEKLHPIKANCVPLYNELKKQTFSEKLLLRAYLRNLDQYNDEVRLNENVMKRLSSKYQEKEYHLTSRIEDPKRKQKLELIPMLTTAHISHLCDDNQSLFQTLKEVGLKKDTLVPFLFTSQQLLPIEGTLNLALEKLLALDFRSYWLTLYCFAISKTEMDNQRYSTLLSALAYCGATMEQINILQSIRALVDSGQMNFPPVIPLPMAIDPTCNNYDESEIAKILKSNSKSFPKSSFDFSNDRKMYEAAKKAYDAHIDANCYQIAQRWKSEFWPCPDISRVALGVMLASNIEEKALTAVNSKIRMWFTAKELKSFMDKVQEKLNEYVDIISATSLEGQPKIGMPSSKPSFCPVKYKKKETLPITIQSLLIQPEDLNVNDLVSNVQAMFPVGNQNASLKPLHSSPKRPKLTPVNHGTPDQNEYSIRGCKLKIKATEDALLQSISKSIGQQIVQKSGLSPRLNPLNLLRNLVISDDIKEQKLSHLIGSLCVLWTNLKRFNRFRHYHLHGKQAELAMELENSGHENWDPMKRPEWLLLELELDITIRKVQVEVANQMMSMPDGGNGVTQLNMGEGKTSVIVPMLCSVLAKEDSLCRATVLSSIFKMNWNILKFSIGGLLNRRLYSFPCRRDMDIDEACVNNIQTSYSECMKLKGVVLTLPEYRLSFRSLAYDNILKGATVVGIKLLQTEDWLRWYARDVLDESDELLSVKYQLVYTIGEQIPVDGGEVRWTVCQQVLDFMQDIAQGLLELHGPTLIEYDNEKKIQHPHEFCPVRLIATKENDEFFQKLELLVTEKYLAEITLPETQMALVSEFLLKKDISFEMHENAMTLLRKDTALLNKILTLAGYIHRGVLCLALSKRWRVEYGVDQKGFRKMAVPFRAKDVAAERTEFGHPDLAIILTHLSYYYSGLSDSQLEGVFTILARKLDPGSLYSLWIQQIPENQVPPSLTDYHYLNFKDALQKLSLFDLIRRHKMVVNFWLSHVVFPKESKQFPGKLVMTASDLVYERQRLPITGFSGTNDSIVLLPLTINQQDLPHLQGTNERMEQTLLQLQPENSGHKALAMGVTCEDILKQMKEDNLRILIDSGALMLELDNEQVAQRWLEIDPGIEATVYFNKGNELMVKSRSSDRQSGGGKPTPGHQVPDVPFELSPFQGKLECCGVFLDDQHTRGTDLKFPIDSKACVTIGSRMKREKLLQACMRMRKLGNGHSVVFYLSHETSNKVMVTRGTLSTSSVLEWVKQNTKEFNDDGLLHWAIASKNYAQRLAAEDIFHFPNWKDPIHTGSYDVTKAKILAEQCVDQEITELMDMYGQHSRLELMTNLIFKWFDCAKQTLIRFNGPNPLPIEVMSRFDEIRLVVWERCHKFVPEKVLLSSSTSMDEEQEKELELEKETEVEEERQVERPPKVSPATPYLHPNVVNVVTNGESFKVAAGVMRMSDIFKDTTFAGDVQPDDWVVEVYATNDFISVIDSSYSKHHKTDSYLRPMEYFISNKRSDGAVQILFLSPYEVNKLLPQIRNHKTKSLLHLFATRKFEKQDMLLNSPRLQLPSAVMSPAQEFCILGSGTREMAALLLASGSLYFNNHNEQKCFANFLCLVAKPWNKRYRELFESGMITPSGFLVPEFRKEQNCVPLGFQRDPMAMVKKILLCRHPVLSDVAHVVRLLNEKTYVRLRNGDDDKNDGDA